MLDPDHLVLRLRTLFRVEPFLLLLTSEANLEIAHVGFVAFSEVMHELRQFRDEFSAGLPGGAWIGDPLTPLLVSQLESDDLEELAPGAGAATRQVEILVVELIEDEVLQVHAFEQLGRLRWAEANLLVELGAHVAEDCRLFVVFIRPDSLLGVGEPLPFCL